MAVTKVVDVLSRAQTILQDTTSTRWPLVELQTWLNDAYGEILIYRPDAATQSRAITLAEGTRQRCTDPTTINLPNLLRVMDVTRNVAVGSDKRSVRRTDRRILDDQRPGWHAETKSLNIQHYMFDDRLPKEFFVYPPAAAGAQVEIVYASMPAAHTMSEATLGQAGTAETVRIDDIYVGALLDYVLYRAYSKDAEYAANGARASGHYAAFANAIGVKTATDGRVSPNAVVPPTPSSTGASTTVRG